MPVYLLEQKAVLDAMGVGIGAVGTHSDLTHPDGVQRRRELDYLRADIALASQLGGTLCTGDRRARRIPA